VFANPSLSTHCHVAWFVGNCRTVIIACVSPVDSNIESSMDTLRLAEKARKVKNVIRRNIEKQRPTAREDNAASSNENKSLKAEVVELRPLVGDEKSEKEETFVDRRELSILQTKMKIAEEAAKSARECSASVAEVADRWRLHREKRENARKVIFNALLGVVDNGPHVSHSLHFYFHHTDVS
jgi:hypothetical protein